VRENRSPGSVRGAGGNAGSYRDCARILIKLRLPVCDCEPVRPRPRRGGRVGVGVDGGAVVSTSVCRMWPVMIAFPGRCPGLRLGRPFGAESPFRSVKTLLGERSARTPFGLYELALRVIILKS